MDAGDFIYILIAIGLAVLNAIGNANKKKKLAEKKRQSQMQPDENPLVQNDSKEESNDLLKKLQELVAEDSTFAPAEEEEHEEFKQEGYTVQSEEVSRAEQSSSDVNELASEQQVTEEELYPLQEAEMLDVQQPVNYEPIDTPVSEVEGQIEEFDYQDSTKIEEERLKSEEIGAKSEIKEEGETVLGDFDPRKAIIYAEIIKRKYF